MVKWFRLEAPAISYLTQQLLAGALAFGANLDAHQVVVIQSIVGAVLMVFTRQAVTPVDRVPKLRAAG